MSEDAEARYYRLRAAEMQTRERHRELAMAPMSGMTPTDAERHLNAREAARLAWKAAEREYVAACYE